MKQQAPTGPVDEYFAHCERARDSERVFLSAGLHYPVEMWNVAVDCGIDYESFIDAWHRRIFDIVCACALLGIRPSPAVIAQEMTHLHFPLSDDELTALWWAEPIPTGLHVWGRQVAFYAARRKQYRSLLSDARDCISDIADDASTMTPIGRVAAA